MSTNNYLQKRARGILTKAYKNGKNTTRNDIKNEQSGRYARYDVISSTKSLEKHLSAINQVAEYITDNFSYLNSKGETKAIVRWNQVTDEMVQAFITHKLESGGRDGLGASEKTLKGYMTAINKVMVTGNHWKASDVRSLSDFKTERGKTNVYKDLTSEEWLARNQAEYQKYQQQIDLARAFGLRREEIFGQKGMENRGKNGLTASSFVLGKNNRLWIQTIGKGGKYRLVPCRLDFNQQMLSFVQANEISLRMSNELAANDSERKKAFIQLNRKETRIVNGIRNGVPLHIFRAEYAKCRIYEEQEEYTHIKNSQKIGYSRLSGYKGNVMRKLYKNGLKTTQKVPNSSITQIKTVTANVNAFIEVSNNLGHNRLDVMAKYL